MDVSLKEIALFGGIGVACIAVSIMYADVRKRWCKNSSSTAQAGRPETTYTMPSFGLWGPQWTVLLKPM
jgi:hypothetical protein